MFHQASASASERLVKVNWIIVTVVALIYGACYLIGQLTSVFTLLGATLVASYALLGPVNWLEDKFNQWLSAYRDKPPFKWLNTRAIAILTIYVLTLSTLFFVSVKTFPVLTEQVKAFSHALPAYTEKLAHRLEGMGTTVLMNRKAVTLPEASLPASKTVEPKKSDPEKAASTQNVKPGVGKATSETLIKISPIATQSVAPKKSRTWQLFTQSVQLLKGYATNVAGYLLNLGTVTVSSIIYTLTGLVILFYFLLDGPKLKSGIVELVPVSLSLEVYEYISTINRVMRNFIQTQVILSVLVWLYLYVALSVLDVEFAILLSSIFALLSIVPLIGPWAGFIPIMLVISLSNDPVDLIPTLVILGAYYLIKEYWLYPRLFKNQVEIHPVLIIVSFLMMLQVAGISGVFLAFPFAGLICGTYQYVIERQKFQH